LGDPVDVFEHVVVPEAHDPEALGFEPRRTFRILLGTGVLPAVHLDHQFALEADKSAM
jgi:hypothetical protein